jgi:hypothetical protein
VLTLTFGTGARAPVAEGRLVQAWSAETGEVYARAFAAADRRWIEWPGVATFTFATPLARVTAWPAPGATPEAIADTFFRVLQPVVLQAIGWQALHASAVAIDGRVVALCGRSGSGKSTLAYAIGRALAAPGAPGPSHFADDAVVIERGDPAMALGLAFAPRLRASARRHFRIAGASRVVDGNPKRLPLAAVVVLEQRPDVAEPIRCRRVPETEAFQRLVTHAHCFDPSNPVEARRLVDDYLTWAARVPVYALTYRPGFDLLPAVIRAVYDVVPARQPAEDGSAVCAGG